ncbi:MAG TPA: BTAD domain-containing putative transcriptional regulator, partial [Herpetosiphonaceae bacterium]|nr:BTAD domain-containing putative transcriptional regulator [Herpetosiphonaceae bacterium]
MSEPKVFLLGAPRLEAGGVPAELDTRKAIALIAYIAITGQRHSRDALANLLWPEYSDTRARASLRRTLSALTRALGSEWLDVERESIGLNQQRRVWVDVDQFHERLAACATHDHPASSVCGACLPLLNAAVELYRDDFLAGFTLRDSPNFDEWQFFQAESLRRELAHALEQLVRGHVARGEWKPAIHHARRRVTLDPLHEPAHRSLMGLYAWAGERGAALRQYRECVGILEQELGVLPLEETTRLYQAIKENRTPPPPIDIGETAVVQTPYLAQGVSPDAPGPRVEEAPSRPTAASQPENGPLVGRTTEWALLLSVYTSIG